MYFREIGLYRRVDVGIDPYEKAGKFQKPRRGGSCVRPCEPSGDGLIFVWDFPDGMGEVLLL